MKTVDVIYNRPGDSIDPEYVSADADTVTTAGEVQKALTRLGYSVKGHELSKDTIYKVRSLKSDMIFNLCEWTGKDLKLQQHLFKQLEKNRKNYTGADWENYFCTTDKIASKNLLSGLNLPTPGWQILKTGKEKLKSLKWPVIIKPAFEHGSLGITQNSVVTNEKDLRKQAEIVAERYKQPVLVEEYIEGLEVKVTIVGNGDDLTVLPIAEVEFGKTFEKAWKILTFPSKWLEVSNEYRDSNTKISTDASLSGKSKLISEVSVAAFRMLGCRDYVRLDIRLDKNGIPYILEVNSNPSLENEPKYAPIMSAAEYGWSYDDLVGQILLTAGKRCRAENLMTNESFSFV